MLVTSHSDGLVRACHRKYSIGGGHLLIDVVDFGFFAIGLGAGGSSQCAGEVGRWAKCRLDPPY
jgi:hypothetical protein